MNNFGQTWENIREDAIALQKDIHRWPETAYEEYRTQDKIFGMLKRYGISDYESVAETGVLVRINGDESGPTVAIRADMDALMVEENTGLAHRSERDGYMHACGHDAHTAIAMGTLLALHKNKETLKGNVKIIFQPAEEQVGGAIHFVKAGHMDDVHGILALHLWPGLDQGTIGIRDGVFMASNDYFEVTITGKAAHCARPNEGIDAIYIGSKMVTELKALAAREVDPVKRAVIGIGSFNGGKSYNAMPQTVSIQGTVRSLDRHIREFLKDRIPELCQSIGALYGAKVDVDYRYQYPITCNNDKVNRIVQSAGAEILGDTNVHNIEEPLMISEDFSFFTEEVPGAMFLLGTYNEQTDCIYPLHHSRFRFDEEATIRNGVHIMYNSVLNMLKG